MFDWLQRKHTSLEPAVLAAPFPGDSPEELRLWARRGAGGISRLLGVPSAHTLSEVGEALSARLKASGAVRTPGEGQDGVGGLL
jgi:hypothetical protein